MSGLGAAHSECALQVRRRAPRKTLRGQTLVFRKRSMNVDALPAVACSRLRVYSISCCPPSRSGSPRISRCLGIESRYGQSSSARPNFWIKIFAVSFGMVVSGIASPFQFGTNWSRYSDTVTDIVALLWPTRPMAFSSGGFGRTALRPQTGSPVPRRDQAIGTCFRHLSWWLTAGCTRRLGCNGRWPLLPFDLPRSSNHHFHRFIATVTRQST